MEELIIDVPFMGVLDILAFYSLIIHDWLLQLVSQSLILSSTIVLMLRTV